MAKTDNLTDFLTDIADAIREKKGTTGTINPQDFSSEIASIESGGGGGDGGSVVTSVPMSDVNFLDYDGTILYSYTKEQFLALSAMPELPTREGLICQGWNYRWGEAVSYVTDYGKLNIGAMYITDDGDTRLYIRIATEGRMKVPLYWSQTVSGGVGIDWGDGSAIQSVSGTGNLNTTHTYAKPGDYVIRLKVANGCTLGFAAGALAYCVMGSTNDNGSAYRNMLQRVEIGEGVTSVSQRAFSDCYSLASVTIPITVTKIGYSAFNSCYSLASITIPSAVTSFETYSSGVYIFYDCYALKSISIPMRLSGGLTMAFYNCRSLVSISIPSSVTNISSDAFHNCFSLTSINIPSSVASIGSDAFNHCSSMTIYDFTHHTSVPTLANTSAFSGIPSDCVIKVPSSLLSAWKSATNWSTYASQIVAG